MRNKQHSINRANQMAVRYLRQTQKAVNHLNALGFTVLNINFTRVKPCIEVDVSNAKGVVRALVRERKAVWYARGSCEELGNWKGYYTMIEGIRVWWRGAVEDVIQE